MPQQETTPEEDDCYFPDYSVGQLTTKPKSEPKIEPMNKPVERPTRPPTQEQSPTPKSTPFSSTASLGRYHPLNYQSKESLEKERSQLKKVFFIAADEDIEEDGGPSWRRSG
ncbi:hypothetical protein NA57DRAFT_81153 [Rhizodiscina lignyota]|uniref:Uncharacterized protein n=1 Tax=Rhizodiscina lignyota TaxID=1504668 RepID=A0A9P4I5Q1_9PEZI|nr:hypothetical protein NA57DRAFT_81153 [Rhizodiscina lignyota]